MDDRTAIRDTLANNRMTIVGLVVIGMMAMTMVGATFYQAKQNGNNTDRLVREFRFSQDCLEARREGIRKENCEAVNSRVDAIVRGELPDFLSKLPVPTTTTTTTTTIKPTTTTTRPRSIPATTQPGFRPPTVRPTTTTTTTIPPTTTTTTTKGRSCVLIIICSGPS